MTPPLNPGPSPQLWQTVIEQNQNVFKPYQEFREQQRLQAIQQQESHNEN